MTKKATFKATSSGLEDKVFEFSKERHAVDFVKKYEGISNLIVVNYKHSGPKIAMAINNMEKRMITVTVILEDTSIRVDVF